MINVFNGTKTLSCGCQLKHNLPYLNRGMEKIKEKYELTRQQNIRCSDHCIHNHHIPSRQQRWYATTNYDPINLFETGFEMATSSIRYGKGITREVGYDIKDLGAKLTAVFVDPNVMLAGIFFQLL